MFLLILFILVLWGLGAAGFFIIFEALPEPIWQAIHKDKKPKGLKMFLVLALWPLGVAYALLMEVFKLVKKILKAEV